MRFTVEEFDIMVNELLYREPVSFDMLCKIAEKTLKKTVDNWCKANDFLRGRGYENDIMQEIYLRLVTKTVSSFLRHKKVNGDYNNDPEGFEDWMFRLAFNIKQDFAKKVGSRDLKTQDIDDSSIGEISIVEYEDNTEETIEMLKKAFSTVISSDVGVYKILTWVAQFIFILKYDITKIKSNEMIVTTFQNKTLYEMYSMILEASKTIPWIEISESQNEKILASLRKERSDGVLYGETKYKDFFMKSNGEPSGKKSISDWNNRFIGKVRPEDWSSSESSKKDSKKTSAKSVKKKENGENESSDC